MDASNRMVQLAPMWAETSPAGEDMGELPFSEAWPEPYVAPASRLEMVLVVAALALSACVVTALFATAWVFFVLPRIQG